MAYLCNKCYYYKKVKEIDMPDYMLLDDLIDDMLSDVSFIKLNTHLNVESDD